MIVTKEDFRIKEYRGKFIIERKYDDWTWKQVSPSGYFIREGIDYLFISYDNLNDAKINVLAMIDTINTINNKPRYHTI
jgi:hypothetical protein